MGAIAFVRCYDVEDLDPARRQATQERPDWFDKHIQTPYLERRRPFQVCVEGNLFLHDGSRCDRFVIAHPALNILEITLFFQVAPLHDFLPGGGVVKVSINRIESPWDKADHDLSPFESPQWACDMTYEDIMGRPPRPPGEASVLISGFNVVALGHSDECFGVEGTTEKEIQIQDLLGPENDPTRLERWRTSFSLLASLSEHQVVVYSRDVIPELDEALPRLAVVAGRLNRTRQMEKRVLDLLDQSVEAVTTPRTRDIDNARAVAHLQEEALLFQSECGHRRFYNTGQSKHIHTVLEDEIGVSQANVDRISSVTSGFSNLVQTYSAIELYRTQHRFSAFGLLFGLLSVVLGAFAIVSVVEVDQPQARWWVVGAIAFILLIMLCLYFWVERRIGLRKTQHLGEADSA